MKLKNQSGFSLIELLVVFVIIGVLAGITAPYLIKAKNKAENTSAKAALKTIFSSQISYFTANGRYARLDELNVESRNTLGIIQGTQLKRGPFLLEMNPPNPTNAELKDGFTIFLNKPGAVGVDFYSLSMDATGIIIGDPDTP